MSSTIGVTAEITPMDKTDKYPIAHIDNIKGGYKSVSTYQELLNIPYEKITLGMRVYSFQSNTEFICTNLNETTKKITWDQLLRPKNDPPRFFDKLESSNVVLDWFTSLNVGMYNETYQYILLKNGDTLPEDKTEVIISFYHDPMENVKFVIKNMSDVLWKISFFNMHNETFFTIDDEDFLEISIKGIALSIVNDVYETNKLYIL